MSLPLELLSPTLYMGGKLIPVDSQTRKELSKKIYMYNVTFVTISKVINASCKTEIKFRKWTLTFIATLLQSVKITKALE